VLHVWHFLFNVFPGTAGDCVGCNVSHLNYKGALADWVTIWVVEDNNQLLKGVSQQQGLRKQTQRYFNKNTFRSVPFGVLLWHKLHLTACT
jgi:hypothetical protein